MQNTASRPRKIAILGGGIGSLVTAFELTSQPGWQERYEITLYQQGHRLGGKGASWRSRTQAGSEVVERIEEHGLHVFFGFYENAFQILRRCYAELDETRKREVARGESGEPRGLTMETAFHPHDLVIMGALHQGQVKSWPIPFPRRKGEPGTQTQAPETPEADESLLDGGTVLTGLLELSTAYFLQLAGAMSDGNGVAEPHFVAKVDRDLAEAGQPAELVTSVMKALGRVLALLPRGLYVRGVPKVAGLLLAPLKRLGDARGLRHPWLRKLLAVRLALLRTQILTSTALFTHDFRIVELRAGVDLALSLAIGLLREDLLHQEVDWFSLDDLDYRDWLRKHGALESTIIASPIETLAAAAFADGPHAGGGAGTCLHLTLRMILTYRKAVIHRMAAGMGETVIAPLYRVLRERGVNFAFFRRVERIERGERDGLQVVERIVVRRQATVRAGQSYQPLELFNGLYCWPKEPRYDQLVEGNALRSHDLESFWNAWDPNRPVDVLELGRDFDICVLGIGLGGLAPICADLTSREPLAWPDGTPTLRASIERLRTVETMAAQLWFKPSFAELDAPASTGIGIAYPQPFDTWTEMDHLLLHERWPREHTPRSLVYLCSSLEEPSHNALVLDARDTEHPARQRELVSGMVHAWLNRYGSAIFTKARTEDGGFDYDLLVDPQGRTGRARFEGQYWCATVNPSDRYVLSVAGTNKHRLRPHQSGYENMVLAGDWTLNPFSAGCVESAVASGREAARVICGRPNWIHGDWLSRVRGEVPKALVARMPEYTHHGRGNVVPFPTTGEPLPPRESGVVPAMQPRFVRRPFDLVPRPPYACQEGLTSWFFFRADPSALRTLVDDCLNAAIPPGGPVYEPLVPLVAFVAAELDKLYSTRDPYGWMAEKDFAFWIPLRVTEEGKAPRFAWFQPGLWVDSGPAVSGGREALGMNKALAKLTADGSKFAIDTIALRALDDPQLTGVPTTQATEERIVELRMGADDGVAIPAPGLDQWGSLIAILPGWLTMGEDTRGWLSELFEQIRNKEVSIVALKQFPEVDGGDQACYQSVVEYPSRAQVIHEIRPRFLPSELLVFPFESHPFVQAFGLQTQDSVADGDGVRLARSVFALSVRFDFTIEAGRVVTLGRTSLPDDMLAESAE
jgi:uncharacterized protein with NAD-binding domain and iron-sulfur cluster